MALHCSRGVAVAFRGADFFSKPGCLFLPGCLGASFERWSGVFPVGSLLWRDARVSGGSYFPDGSCRGSYLTSYRVKGSIEGVIAMRK